MRKKLLQPKFINKVIDKVQLKQIIIWAFRNYGIAHASNMADKIKDLGFYYATKAGISLSLEDLRIPPVKEQLLAKTIYSIAETDKRHKRGEITTVERFQKVIDTWNNASETLKKEIILYFKNTDPLNTIYMMAFSGARGNISQVRQLVGMRGLMSDPQGQIIDLPISSNFREGLTITDYFISSYGARKGLVDTALRTADSGYLTRRLVDVAQDVIIRETNCKTSKGILLEEMVDNQKVLISLKQALIGRILAEDVVDNFTNKSIAYKDQCVEPELANYIARSGRKSILVRSPITCDSIQSVCQLCYGWNLAHGKMVDLGEAVGIIAAQSIGEPGTQLTMRTFHTGGVFTGELAQTIISPKDAILEYMQNMPLTNARTRYGDEAQFVNSDCKIKLVESNGNEILISLTKGSLLLAGHKSIIKAGSVIAEYPLSNRVMTERAQNSVVADCSGSVHIENLKIKEIRNKQNVIKSAETSGVIWILSGIVHNINDDANIILSQNERIYENSIMSRTQLISRYSGRVSVPNQQNKNINQQISIIMSTKTFIGIKVYIDNNDGSQNHILLVDQQDKFLLTVLPNQKVNHGQIIGNLISNLYKTKTGGIIKYLDLPISKKKTDNKNDYYDILGPGYILWIPEETHEINKDISLLLVQHGDFVDLGTEIIKNVFANNSGIVEVVEKEGIIREIIIKPGKVYTINNKDLNQHKDRNRGFLRPGEKIINEIVSDKLVYWEHIKIKEDNIILIRPVVVYSVPNKGLTLSYTADSFEINMIDLKLIRRTYFRDGARVKSVYGVNLINTHLVVNLNTQISDINCRIEFIKNNLSSSYSLLKLSTFDPLSLKDSNVINSKNFYTKTSIKVKNGEYITSGSIVAETEVISMINGKVMFIQDIKHSNRRMLIIRPTDIRTFKINNTHEIKIQINDWVYTGDEIATNIFTLHSGQIIDIQDTKIIIRIGQPFLISSDSILHIHNNSLIKRGESLATLIFERAKTGDIVQGLPRIEEILEARKKAGNSFNPHHNLESNFRGYLNKGLSVYDSTRLSLLDTQLELIKEVQLVYQLQGVDISDKHIEVIVRQMTSKVKIENGGNTDYLPGEMVELQKIESVNKSLSVMNKNKATYHPILLGITKASLNTESFISAASFQETTKVLTEAAISGKLDWLRGLKENVIIGRLIPAGTGFKIHSNSLLNTDNSELLVDNNILNKAELNQPKSNFEDIILDDRTARNYPIKQEKDINIEK
ncbi:RNA polymerase beta'' subunit (plastid) [Chondrus crispus]|uniref:DNA-directed RNA polymerase n=1 Tax=Chondrus crispus TaxID=2769 RepID=M5DDJ1_CHOCR|nr:RNA polymerase beta'' subunit [Chondrus crispus]CCP38174.1 RNA polymerase beta'' subunit [Chondrus crispus]|eukprot:YP_007627427.1 RNA polymerase beta'' subunit (plastid) [Chondrus crispus]